jgi:DNA polymerase III gamma/tau subunit
VFGLVEHLVDEGYDLVEFHHGLLDVFRTLLRLRLQPDALVDAREDFRAALAERAAGFETGDLVRMLTSAAELESQGSLRRTPNPRLPIEMLLLRLSFLERTVQLEELIQAMGGAPSPEGGAGSSGGAKAAPASKSKPSRTETAGAAPTGAAPSTAPTSRPAPTAEPAPATSTAAKSAPDAWTAWLNQGTVPKGMAAFLRGARVRDLEDGRVEVSGLADPAAERLADLAVMEAIREAFSPYLGRPAHSLSPQALRSRPRCAGSPTPRSAWTP